MPPPQPDAARALFSVIIILLYFYSSPDSAQVGNGFHSPRELFTSKLDRQHHALDVLNSSRYGDFSPNDRGGTFLNLTGFRREDGYSWEGLGVVKDMVAAEAESEMRKGTIGHGLGIYGNVTGIVKGKWVRGNGEQRDWGRLKEKMNLTEIAPDISWGGNMWSRNITGMEGVLRLNVEERAEWGVFPADDYIREQDEDDTDENSESYVREVAATLTVQDETSMGDGWEMRVHGVHWPRRGQLVMTTTSEKFAGIFGLPHMMSNRDDFNSSQKVLNKTLGAALRKKEKSLWIDLTDPWSSDESMPMPNCEFVVFLQVHPIKNGELHRGIKPTDQIDVISEILDIERELRFPTGAPVFDAPPLRMSFIAFSPDCGFLLESKGPPAYTPAEGQHLHGIKQEIFIRRIKNWSLIWGLVLLAQVLLIRVQMKDASTPSTVSRVSLYTMAIMLIADALLFSCMMLLASSVPDVFPTATLAAFAVSMSLGTGVRFLREIYIVQEPERLERQRQRHQAAEASRAASLAALTRIMTPGLNSGSVPTTADAPISNSTILSSNATSNSDTIPPPAIAQSNTSPSEIPVIVPSDQDIDAEVTEVTAANSNTNNVPILPTRTPGQDVQARVQSDAATSYGQGAMLFMCFFFLTISSTSWPPPLRTAYVNTIGFLYLSFWIPQIYRNIMRNCRKALLWKFVLGQSILRAAPFGYFFLKEDNVLFATPSKWSMGVLTLWLWLQIWVLAAQEVLGPRFGLPTGWLPEAWNYHPILREDDAEGGGMPIGLVQTPESPTLERMRTSEEGRKKTDGHTRSVDCAICMNVLEVPVVPAGIDTTGSLAGGAGGVTGMLARRLYMVTPCRHVFHSTCLESWMRFRLQCPICRETLPPL